MADNITIPATGSGDATPIVATDQIGTTHYQKVKLVDGTAESATAIAAGGGVEAGALRVTLASDSTGLVSVDDGGGSLTVDGTITVQDGAGSLTVDNAALSVVGGGAEATALRVTLANDSTGLVSVDDNGGSLTIDGTVTANAGSGPWPVTDNGGSLTIDGTVTANAGSGPWPVTDNSGSLTVDNAGAFAVQVDSSGSVVDAGNSSTATLGISGNFTGTGVDCLGYSSITITVDASHNSAASGMVFEFSTDNTNYDDNYTFTYTASEGARRFQFPVTARYFRVNYTNGGSAQTHFRLQALLHTTALLTSIHRLGNNTTPDRSAQLIKSALIAQVNGTGDFIPIQATSAGILKVGGSVQIDAGTNQIGDVVVNDIEDGAGTSAMDSVNNAMRVNVVAGSGSGTEYTEDAAGAGGESGPFVLGRRQDADATPVSLDGDYHGLLFDANGYLKVNVKQGGGSGGVSHVDDTAFTPATDSVTPAGFVFDDTTPDSVDEGDAGYARMSANRNVYTTIRDAAGNERGANVNASNRLAVVIEQDDVGIGGGTQYNVDAALGATPTGTLSLAKRDDALSALTPVEGDAVELRVDANGGLWVTPTGTVNVADAGGSLTVDGTVTADAGTGPWPVTDNAGSLTVDNPTLSVVGGGLEATALRVTLASDGTGLISVDDNGGSLTVDNAALSVVGGGVEATALRVTLANDSTGVLSVDDNGGNLSVDDGGGTLTVDQATAANLNAQVVGAVADDGADSGNPVKVGGVAVAIDGTDPTSVAEGDRANLRTDLNRRLLVSGMHPNYWRATGNYSTAQTDVSVKAAPGAGLSLYVTDVVLTTDTAMNIFLEEGTTKVVPAMYFAANGGAAMHFQTPLKLTANTALTLTSSAAGNHSVLVSGYTAP